MSRRIGGVAVAILLLAATAEVRADGLELLSIDSSRPAALFSLQVFVRHHRVARVTVGVGMAAGLTCAALGLVQLYGDCARYALDAVPASAIRRDVIAFSAGTVLLSVLALAFDALGPAPSPTSAE